MTMDDYLAARPVSTPLGLFDCDVPVDGSIAFVVSHADYAPDSANHAPKPLRAQARRPFTFQATMRTDAQAGEAGAQRAEGERRPEPERERSASARPGKTAAQSSRERYVYSSRPCW